MALYQRGRIWYADYYANGERFQESTGKANKREAEKFLALRLSEVQIVRVKERNAADERPQEGEHITVVDTITRVVERPIKKRPKDKILIVTRPITTASSAGGQEGGATEAETARPAPPRKPVRRRPARGLIAA